MWCQTTVRPLNDFERVCSEHKQLCDSFDTRVCEKLGPKATMNDFDHDELAPAHEQYFNKSGDMVKGSPDDMPKVLATSEYGDQYVNVDIMFIWETSLSRGGA